MRFARSRSARAATRAACLLSAHTLGNPEEKGASAGCRVQNRDCRIPQTFCAQVLTQRSVQRSHHVFDHLNRRVIDAEALALLGIEGLQKVFVEVQDRVAPIAPNLQNLRRDC